MLSKTGTLVQAMAPTNEALRFHLTRVYKRRYVDMPTAPHLSSLCPQKLDGDLAGESGLQPYIGGI